MGMTWRIKRDNTDEVKEALKRQVALALGAVGKRAVSDVKKRVPVITNRLRSSITYVVDDNKVAIGTNVEYAIPVEVGHMQEVGRYVPAIGKRLVSPHVEGKHYLRDGINSNIGTYKDIIQKILKG